MGKVYDAQGRVDEAIAQFQKVRAIVGEKPYGLYCLGHAYGRAGRKSEALKVIEELRKFSTQGYSMSYDIAYVYYGLGDDENTFRWLRTALEERHLLLVRMKTEPVWEGLRSDARFEGVLKNIGLPQ